MKCLHCGYCCHHYAVIIVDDPEKGLSPDNVIGIHFDGSVEPCKHLIGGPIPGTFRCAIHSQPWYKQTPCFAHTQIEETDSNCRMGQYILEKEGTL